MTATPVGSEILVNTATAGFQGLQQITALSNGGFVVTWEDGNAGGGGATLVATAAGFASSDKRRAFCGASR
jgi:hypothetical protein